MSGAGHEEGPVAEGEGRRSGAGGDGDAGTAAVLYGMLTTFSEALGGLDGRLAAIEAAVHARPDPPVEQAAAPPARLDEALSRLEEAMERVLVAVEGRQAGIDLVLDTLRSLATRVEAMGVRVERAREGIEEVVRSTAWLPDATRSLQALESSAVGRPAAADADAVAALGQAVRSQSERFEQHAAELAAAVASLRALLDAHVQETAHSLGRRATEAGRRLAGDLGLRGRPRQPPAAQ